ncbi:HK97 gp10 family phage protein [Clostridium botulinum]|uniref:HK97 gp10 family phage protein n=1 Tax=Clostridium botulinum TaxID=1491 RepID=UPI0004D5AC57|nr:HK97 gp10 family phage protein [Clostridium botulinum]KEI01568.1 hypothetical protein Z952_11995 [Clostridium botulinum C/D str. BKT75002]KEI07902.1 hypothetical protein Z954_03130 [Clostridium botulinum C/D str. BKT2873]QPW61573.1 hypothetical protein IG390_05255 [Clostridium botulinum]
MDINDLAAEITEELGKYSREVTDGVKKAVDTTAKEVNEEIKSHITFKKHTGEYVKAFRIKTSYEDKYNKRKTWYVANGQHRLTHLLEKGHALRNGGRAEAFEHIKYGEELAKRRMEELVREAIENDGY